MQLPRAKKMQLLELKVAALAAIIILVSIISVYPLLIDPYTIHSSGIIELETGPLTYPFSYASELRYTYFGSDSMLSPDWPLVASTVKSYDMAPIIQKALYPMYAPFPLTPINGGVFSPNKLRQALDACHEQGIKYHLSMAVMYGVKDPSHRQVNAAGMPIDVWNCASNPDFRNHIRAIVEELVERYEIDGFSFDYVRYDSVDSCYCQHCKANFEEYLGETIADSDFRTGGAFAPGGARYMEFMQWRSTPINELVGLIRQWMDTKRQQVHPELPPIEFTATTWGEYVDNGLYYYGQDCIFWVKEGYIDVILPMYYLWGVDTVLYYFDLSQKLIGGSEGMIPLAPLLTHCHGGIKPPSSWKDEVLAIQQNGADGWSSWCYGGPGDESTGYPDMTSYWDLVPRLPVFSLSNINALPTDDSCTITWTTDLPATSKVEYSISPLFKASKIAAPSPDYPYAQLDYWDIDHVPGTDVEDATPKTSHSITLTELSPGTLYYFRVQSEGSGGTATSKVYTFQL